MGRIKTPKLYLPARNGPKKRTGFTLIEVLIVLALVGIIMLVLFLAVPAARRSHRNHQRRRDVSAMLAYVVEQRTFNLGQYPSSCNNTTVGGCFVRDINLSYYDNQNTATNYVSFWNRGNAIFVDGVDEQLDPSDPYTRERIAMRTFARCNGGLLTGNGATVNTLAAQFAVETANGGTLQCIDA